MFGGGRDTEEASNRLGFPAELINEAEGFREVEVYPDNAQTVKVFADMQTQWRTGANGPIGLDYKALPIVWSTRRIKLANREEIFEGVQIMERAALKEMRKK